MKPSKHPNCRCVIVQLKNGSTYEFVAQLSIAPVEPKAWATHREQVRSIHAAKQESMNRAAALFTSSYLAFVRENSCLLPRVMRRLTKRSV